MPKKPDIAITVTAAPRKRPPQGNPTKEIRHGAFTRIEDDPIAVSLPPVLLVEGFDGDFNVILVSYDTTNPRSPKSPKLSNVPTAFSVVAREKSIAFPSPLGVTGTSDLLTLNISKPRTPTVSGAAVGAGPLFVVLEDDKVYWTLPTTHEIAVADVSDPSTPAVIAYYAYSVFPAGSQQFDLGRTCAVLNKRMYVANFEFDGSFGDNNNFLATYDFTTPAAATLASAVLLEDLLTANNQMGNGGFDGSPHPPTVLGDGVVYVGYTFRDSPAGGYTTKLLTFSLTNPDVPALVNSVVVNTGTKLTVQPVHRFYVNRLKTKLFLFTHNPDPSATPTTDQLHMYDITTPAAPALLATLVLADITETQNLPFYARGDGVVYLGILNVDHYDIQVYDVSGGAFELVNTVVSVALGPPCLALDNKGFPL